MAFQNSNSFYGGSGGIPASGGQQRLALDNLIRRELKVGDPNDPKQIAEALLNRFKDDPRANAITQEAKGLPFLSTSPLQVPSLLPATSCETELKQAMDDVDSDLQELTTNTLLKDSASELRGWAHAIRTMITEGMTAARFALDTRQRDKVFAIRRQLGDYARLARMIGALTPSLSPTFRSFAKSLDEVASVFLVMMGEALANIGFTGGRFLLQVPYTELQVRREAAIAALRNLTGSTEVSSLYQNDYQRGLNAYRKLYKFLDHQGQGDLRVLLLENELARAMDEIIQRAAHGTVDGLRALGATVEVDLDRFRRLIAVGNQLEVDSPPLGAFLDALLLFVQAFDAAGGFRLLRIARPPILFYGLYGTGFASTAEKRLLDLITSRGLLADQADCYLQCGCGEGAVRCQILLDKVLYDVDRAIDLYAVGEAEWGEPEIRAGAYGFLAKSLADGGFKVDGTSCLTDSPDISKRLLEIASKLLPQDFSGDWLENDYPFMQLLNLTGTELAELTSDNSNIVDALKAKDGKINNPNGWLPTDLDDFLNTFFTDQTQKKDWSLSAVLDAKPAVQALMKSELCNQFNREIQDTNGRGLRRIVETIAPNCVSLDVIYGDLRKLMDDAIERIEPSHVACQPLDVNYPITEASSGQGQNLAALLGLSPADQTLYRNLKFNPHPILTGPGQITAEAGGIDLTIEEKDRRESLRLLKQLLDAAQGNEVTKFKESSDEFYDFIGGKQFISALNLNNNLKKMGDHIVQLVEAGQLDDAGRQGLRNMCLEIAGAIGLNIPN